MTAPKVIPSGIAPKIGLNDEILRKAREIGELFYARVETALLDLSQLQHAALERLEEWTPTERLLDLKEAAIYLKLKSRTLDGYTSGAKPMVQFVKIGGRKRFRKIWLDNYIDNGSVKPRVVKL